MESQHENIVLHDLSNYLGNDEHGQGGNEIQGRTDHEAGRREVEGAGRHEFSLPQADGGKDAWLFLAAGFVVEALVWGMSHTH